MYWRYFLWNFVGRQNDLQGDGGLLRGGVMTGIPFIDSIFYGDADTLPEQMTDNKGHNVYYALPLLLGLLGLFFQIGYGRRGDGELLDDVHALLHDRDRHCTLYQSVSRAAP